MEIKDERKRYLENLDDTSRLKISKLREIDRCRVCRRDQILCLVAMIFLLCVFLFTANKTYLNAAFGAAVCFLLLMIREGFIKGD